MNNELKYNGKTLDEMTDNELSKQYELNKQRIIGNGAFLGVISGISLIYCPPFSDVTTSGNIATLIVNSLIRLTTFSGNVSGIT